MGVSLGIGVGAVRGATMWSYTEIESVMLPWVTLSFLRSKVSFQSLSAPSASRKGSPTWPGRCRGDAGEM